MDETAVGPAPASAEASEVWLRTANDFLCGLNHALSNRVSTLASVFLGGDTEGSDDDARERLDVETAKVDALLRLYRLLERSEGAPAEPARVDDAVSDALALLAYHPEVRFVACTASGEGDVPPVLLVPSALVHALLVLLCAAAERAGPGAAGIQVHYSGTPEWVTIAVETRAPVPEGQTVEVEELRAVRWLLRSAAIVEAEARATDGGMRLELRLPTLANLRRRERGD